MARRPGAHISVNDLSHHYGRHGPNVLENITLEIQPGSATALIGRSGCGKSTLLHLISGLQRPSDGAIRIDGRLVEGPSPAWVVMFQQASLYPWMTVAQNVALGLRFTRRSAEARTKVPELLELVELSEFTDRNVQDLSGGQQQRVALARSLAVGPEILMLDEPFSALDTFTRAALQRDVRRIARNAGITLVLVTHDINEAVVMADRAVVMATDPGRVFRDVSLPLSDDERRRPGAAFKSESAKLRAAFEEAAGFTTNAANAIVSGITHATGGEDLHDNDRTATDGIALLRRAANS